MSLNKVISPIQNRLRNSAFNIWAYNLEYWSFRPIKSTACFAVPTAHSWARNEKSTSNIYRVTSFSDFPEIEGVASMLS